MSTRTQVRVRFEELAERSRYAHPLFTYLGDASNVSYNIPSAPTPTNVSLASRGAPAAFSPNNQVLSVDQTVGFNTLIPITQQNQLLGGGAFIDALAFEHYHHAMSALDDAAYAAMVASCSANAGLNTAAFSGDNVTNADLSAMTTALVARAEADLVGGGTPRQTFLHFMSPRAFGAARNLYGAQVEVRAVESPMLGVSYDMVTINGIPALECQSLPNSITAAVTASEVTSNVLTVTVGAGHGFQVGMEVTTSGLSADVDTAAAITAATATTITVPLTTSDAADNGTGTITCDAAVSMLVPQSKAYWAGDDIPDVKEVDDSETPLGRALQVGAQYGARVFDGYARQILWPN